jgi:hypothetical protein
MGIRGTAFDRKVAEVDGQVNSDDPTQFEIGLAGLGNLLGFEALRPSGQAAPDGVWRDDDDLWMVFEAKTAELPHNPVSVAEVRQAGSHHEWIRNQLGWQVPRQSITLLVSYKQAVDPSAAAIAGDVRLVSPSVIRDIAGRTFAVHREIRARARGLSDEQLVAAFSTDFGRRRLHSPALLALLAGRRIAGG